MTTTTSAKADRHAFDIAALLGVALVPGHYLEPAGDGHTCSCGVAGCPEPGAHPLLAGSTIDGRHSLLLPLGGQCDALDVPARTGSVALGYLRLWAVPLGPVIEYPARMAFLVAPEARDDLPGLLIPERLGDPRRGIRYRDAGYLPLPPSNASIVTAGREAEPWAGRLPAAAELLGALAYAGHQLQRTAPFGMRGALHRTYR